MHLKTLLRMINECICRTDTATAPVDLKNDIENELKSQKQMYNDNFSTQSTNTEAEKKQVHDTELKTEGDENFDKQILENEKILAKKKDIEINEDSPVETEDIHKKAEKVNETLEKEEASQNMRKEAVQKSEEEVVKPEKIDIKIEPENKPPVLKYPFGVLDLTTLRGNTHIVTQNKHITRRINLNPFYKLTNNSLEEAGGVDSYCVDSLLNVILNGGEALHPHLSIQSGINSQSHWGVSTKLSTHTLLSLYLTKAAFLNSKVSNMIVLPDEFFMDSMEIIDDNNNLKTGELAEKRKKILSATQSAKLFPSKFIPSSLLNISENSISIDTRKEPGSYYALNYSREILTITYVKENQVEKRWAMESAFGSYNFRKRFYELLMNVVKSKFRRYNFITDISEYVEKKMNVIVCDFSGFIINNSRNVNMKDSEKDNENTKNDEENSEIYNKELFFININTKAIIDAYLLNIDNYKTRIPISLHPTVKSNITLNRGALPDIVVNFCDIRKEMDELFINEFKRITDVIIKHSTEQENGTETINLAILPLKSNIVHFHIDNIHQLIEKHGKRDEYKNINYMNLIPSQKFTYIADPTIQMDISKDISSTEKLSEEIKKEVEEYNKEIQLLKSFSGKVALLRRCKHVSVTEMLREIRISMKKLVTPTSVYKYKSEVIGNIKDLLKKEDFIVLDIKFYSKKLKEFQEYYDKQKADVPISIFGKDAIEKFEERIKDDYYEIKRRSEVEKEMTEFIMEINKVKKHIEDLNKKRKEEEKKKKDEEKKKKEEEKKKQKAEKIAKGEDVDSKDAETDTDSKDSKDTDSKDGEIDKKEDIEEKDGEEFDMEKFKKKLEKQKKKLDKKLDKTSLQEMMEKFKKSFSFNTGKKDEKDEDENKEVDKNNEETDKGERELERGL